MKRISDETFKKGEADKDKIIAVRIQDGEFYYIGMMENAENYSIKIPQNYEACHLMRDVVIAEGDIQKAGEVTDGWNRQMLLSNVYGEKNEFASFLKCVNPYYDNHGITDGDHDIFIVTREEIASVSDALKNGDYIFIMND